MRPADRFEDEIAKVRPMNGVFVGALDNDEIKAFDTLCREGLAYREYKGASGLLGLASVRLCGEVSA